MNTSETQETSRLEIERCDDAAEWDAFVERNDGPPFALWGWGDAAESYGHDRWYFVARDEGTIAGVLPLVHMESRLFGSKLVSPPFGERGSLVLGSSRSEEAAELLLERTRELADDLDVDFVSLRGTEIGERSGFTERSRFVTFRVPLSDSTASAWERVKSSRQRQVRQAEDASLTYRVGEELSDLKEYYRLYLKSMRGHGTPPHSFDFFRILWDRFADDGHLHLGMVEKDGELINGIIDLSLGSSVHQWGVITDYEHRDLNGGSLALWKSIERASEEGYEVYDMGRTREGSGVYLFKKSFGGEKTWYDDSHYFPNGETELPHPERDAYDPIKRAWKRLPIPLTRVVGPRIRKGISL